MQQFYPYLTINGNITESNSAVIPAVTSGVLSGEGFFTTIKVRQKIPLFFDKHQDRLQQTSQALHFGTIESFNKLETTIKKLLDKNELSECSIRVTILNNTDQAVTLIQASELPNDEQDIKLITLPETRDALRIFKTINRIINNQALTKAQEKGAEDAVFVQDTNLIEATYATIFSINREGTLITPGISNLGLDSITKQVLNEQTAIIETAIPEDTEGPLVLVSSLRTRSVESLNGRQLRDAGKLYERICKLRKEAENKYINARK